jgi:hypothetical protein
LPQEAAKVAVLQPFHLMIALKELDYSSNVEASIGTYIDTRAKFWPNSSVSTSGCKPFPRFGTCGNAQLLCRFDSPLMERSLESMPREGHYNIEIDVTSFAYRVFSLTTSSTTSTSKDEITPVMQDL